MAYLGPVHRWDIFWADLDHPVGSERGGARRPVIIVSNDGVNASLDLVTQIPLTKLEGKQRKVYPFEVQMPPEVVGTGYTSIAMPQQVRTISRTRLLEKIGRVDDPDLQDLVEVKLMEHFGIAFDTDDL